MENSTEPFLNVQTFLPNSRKQEEGFSGRAKSVSGRSSEGNFDILPTHANFIGLVLDKLVIKTVQDQIFEIAFGKGFVETSENNVKIFLEF